MRPPIVLTTNTNDEPVYGYVVNGMTIYAPTVSECGRFAVDPMEAYGLTPADVEHLSELNALYGLNDIA